MKRLFYYTLALTASVVFLSRASTQPPAHATTATAAAGATKRAPASELATQQITR